MSEEVKNQTEGKEVSSVNEDELAGLIAQNSKLQEKENEGEGVRLITFCSLSLLQKH